MRRLAGGAEFALFLVTLAAIAHSVQDMYRGLTAVRSLCEIDVKTLGVEGELQYQIQESRRQFLQVLIDQALIGPPSGDASRRQVDSLREADRQVGVLRNQVILLGANRPRLDSFQGAWLRYLAARDQMIELSLRGRLSEALAFEQERGITLFDRAAHELRLAKSERESSSWQKADNLWNTLFRACFEVLGLLIASLMLLGSLLANRVKKTRILGELRAAGSTLSESEQRFRSIFQEAAVGITIMDLKGRITSVNRAMTEITGYTEEELIGRNPDVILAPEHQHLSADSLAQLARGQMPAYRAERQIVRKNGEKGWIRTSVSLVQRNGVPAELTVLCEDISEQKRVREQLSFQATHDTLTGIANRRHFETELESAVRQCHQNGTAMSLLYIDLDGFKLVNDTVGHSTGDALLAQVASRFLQCMVPGEFLARIGGDEFAVIQRAQRDGGSPAALAKRLLDSISRPFSVHSNSLHIGASIGISQYPVDGSSAQTLLQNADAAMYHAKRTQNNGFYFFDAHMRQNSLRRLAMERHIRAAIEHGELRVHYQPLYDLETNSIIRFEALCRWKNPELGEVSPNEFIPVAEETGVIGDLGRWVLRQACQEARHWYRELGHPVNVAVNVSAIQFAEPDYVQGVKETLAATGLPPALLELELTESTLLVDRTSSIGKMHLLREMGISISIDDFGTGYSSLSYLHSMPVDALKIDQSFIRGLDLSPAAAPMISAMIAMARALGLRVVTEGVETAGQLETVRRLGADEVQGYYLGRPENAEGAFTRAAESAAKSMRDSTELASA